MVNNDDTKKEPSKSEVIEEDKEESQQDDDKQETSIKLPRDWIIRKDHSLDNILGDIKKGVSTCF